MIKLEFFKTHNVNIIVKCYFQPIKLQLTYIASTEPGVALFKVESLQCQVYLNPTHMQSLHIKVSPFPNDVKQNFQWSLEELQVIEQFFDFRVAAPPYRPSALCGFGKTLNLLPIVLKDAVQLMPGAKWNLQFCMRVPPSASPPIVPVGNPGVLTCREKILFFVSIWQCFDISISKMIVSIFNISTFQLQLTRVPYMQQMDQKDAVTLALPLVYVVTKNLTQLVSRENVSSPIAHALNEHLKRFADYTIHSGECSLFPAVRDLLMNFILPNELPPVLPNQLVSSPMGASPNPMMHSPMQGMNQGGNPPTMGIPVQQQPYGGGMGGV